MSSIHEVILLPLFWLFLDQRVASDCAVTPCDVSVTFHHKLSKPHISLFPATPRHVFSKIPFCVVPNSVHC